MSFQKTFMPSCEKQIVKLCRKNPVLASALENKITEIICFPDRYKPLKHSLAGENRVHITKSFVLRFQINESEQKIIFTFFGHHDEAYRR